MPWALIWGSERFVAEFLDGLSDPAERAQVEKDLDLISQHPDDPAPLPWWDWQGEDYLDFWRSRVALVANRYHVRYVAWRSAPHYLVVTITDRTTGRDVGAPIPL